MRESETRWKKQNRDRHLRAIQAWHKKQRETNPKYVADQKARSKAWYEKNKNDPEFRKKRSEASLRYFKTEKGRLSKRNARLRSEYGISLADYDALLEKQGGVCAICKRPQRNIRQINNHLIAQLSVDHNHATGKNRGLLCSDCNLALGGFQESPKILQSALEYLLSWENS